MEWRQYRIYSSCLTSPTQLTPRLDLSDPPAPHPHSPLFTSPPHLTHTASLALLTRLPSSSFSHITHTTYTLPPTFPSHIFSYHRLAHVNSIAVTLHIPLHHPDTAASVPEAGTAKDADGFAIIQSSYICRL